MTIKNVEQINGVLILQRLTGEEQAISVCGYSEEWGLFNIEQAMCCDISSFNTDRLNGACILIEQNLGKDLLFIPCRNHVYELVLKSVFETKITQVTSSINYSIVQQLFF